MIHKNLCIFLILMLLLLLQSKPSLSLDYYYQNCSAPTTCGHQNISYPFFIQGKQESFCGYPGFHLSCSKDNEVEFPILQLSGNDYIIHNIDYEKQSLLVSNALLSNLLNRTSCSSNISSVSNLTLSNDQFKLGGNQDKIFLLYKCSSSIVESVSEYKVGCFDLGINRNGVNTSPVLALPSDEYRELGDVEVEKCGGKMVVTHVEGDSDNYGVREELKRGFVLNWLAGDCSRCRESGGLCGFNYTTYHFRCLCPDRTHSVRCSDKG